MSVGEVSSVSSYQGQGSQVKAPVVTSDVTKNSVSSNDTANQAATYTSGTGSSSIVEDSTNKSEQKGGATSSLKEAVNKINKASNSCEAVFSMHEETGRVMIKMVDKDTKEVIREFPAEETLDLIAKAWELAGIMVDERR